MLIMEVLTQDQDAWPESILLEQVDTNFNAAANSQTGTHTVLLKMAPESSAVTTTLTTRKPTIVATMELFELTEVANYQNSNQPFSIIICTNKHQINIY